MTKCDEIKKYEFYKCIEIAEKYMKFKMFELAEKFVLKSKKLCSLPIVDGKFEISVLTMIF